MASVAGNDVPTKIQNLNAMGWAELKPKLEAIWSEWGDHFRIVWDDDVERESKARTVARTAMFEEELMAKVWHPLGAMFTHFMEVDDEV